jgi:hypothetical protein
MMRDWNYTAYVTIYLKSLKMKNDHIICWLKSSFHWIMVGLVSLKLSLSNASDDMVFYKKKIYLKRFILLWLNYLLYYFNRDNQCQQILSLHHRSQQMKTGANTKQVLYTTVVVFLESLYSYVSSVDPDSFIGRYLLK